MFLSPFSKVVFNAEDAGKSTHSDFIERGIYTIILKAQVHAGGRGKGIVHDINSNEEVMLYDKPVKGVNILNGWKFRIKPITMQD